MIRISTFILANGDVQGANSDFAEAKQIDPEARAISRMHATKTDFLESIGARS
jgi:hypothetical protein